MKKIKVLTIVIAVFLVFVSCGIVFADSAGANSEVIRTCTLRDGVIIAVHYDPIILRQSHASPKVYAEMILSYSAQAYNEIVYRQGFDTPGFTFANPDKNYCYDKDGTVDIYILENGKAKDAPCYDIIKREGRGYDACVRFPADYKSYLRSSGAANISMAGITRKIKGSLFHEMSHVILYSYNKNIESWYVHTAGYSSHQGGDWYVEGLARYFETIGDSYENFFSKGFNKKNGKKIVLSQEGVNYLMAHPSESLKEARYDYSLFWAYLHDKYGMAKVEEISRKLRFISAANMNEELPAIISDVLKEEMGDLLKDFAMTMYLKEFNRSIKNGLDTLKIASPEDFSDSIYIGLSSWSSNFIKLDLNKKGMPNIVTVKKTKNGKKVSMTALACLNNGSISKVREIALDSPEMVCKMNLKEMKKMGVKELTLIVTNGSADRNEILEIGRY